MMIQVAACKFLILYDEQHNSSIFPFINTFATRIFDLKVFFIRATQSHCDSQTCPMELIMPPDDCHVNNSLSFTLQVSKFFNIWIFC